TASLRSLTTARQQGISRFFRDIMRRLDDGGAKWAIVGVGNSLVVHCYGVKPRGAEGFAVGIDFFQMPPKRFLTVVDACHNLKRRAGGRPPSQLGQSLPLLLAEPLCLDRCRIEHLPEIPTFVGQMIRLSPLERGEVFN